MRVRDKTIKQIVDVADAGCLTRECYWPRLDPGIFVQGVGYRERCPGQKPEWLCGNREIHGCPEKYCHKVEVFLDDSAEEESLRPALTTLRGHAARGRPRAG